MTIRNFDIKQEDTDFSLERNINKFISLLFIGDDLEVKNICPIEAELESIKVIKIIGGANK